MQAARALVAPALPPRACSTQRLRSGAPLSRRREQRRGGWARASLVDSAITLAEASAGAFALQLASRALGAGGKKAATGAAASALSSVAAAPDVILGVEKKWVKLACSVALDGIGVSSFLLPVLGEATDAGWAPISAVLVQALYGNRLLSVIDFFEEALPFSDALPTACIGWTLEYSPLGAIVGFVPKDAKKDGKAK